MAVKYRKKPVIVDAMQWYPGVEHSGVAFEESVVFIGGRGHGSMEFAQKPRPYVVTIHNQRAYLTPGDWIIVEPDGVHYYPCKPDIFEAIYESVSPDSHDCEKIPAPNRST